MKFTEETYVDFAENAILKLMKQKETEGKEIVTTTQIRNLLAMTMDIKNDILESGNGPLSSEILERIQYLKIRILYEAGRTPSVKALVEAANLRKILEALGETRRGYLLFCRYMEALVAFRKFLVEKDA